MTLNPKDKELLDQLVIATEEGSCSARYSVEQSYRLGIAAGKCQQAESALAEIKDADSMAAGFGESLELTRKAVS